jgi:uncharacterized membrane protein YeiH
MSDPWFSEEFAQNLVWLSFLGLLSLLALFPLQGRYRRAMTSIWTTAIILGGFCLGGFVLALAFGQPSHVWVPFLVMGVCLTGVFGGTYRAMNEGYREAELRKTVARDI